MSDHEDEGEGVRYVDLHVATTVHLLPPDQSGYAILEDPHWDGDRAVVGLGEAVGVQLGVGPE